MSPNTQERATLGQNRENLRQHNLSTVLRLLHEAGSVPRSHLTSITGLNRSTISDLVGELVSLGLAVESEAVTGGGVGRPSLVVAPSQNVVAFSVNPDIDATTVGLVGFDGKVLQRMRYPTKIQPTAAESLQVAAKLIANLRSKLAPGTLIAGIGIAVPGQIRVSEGVVRYAPHLNWVEEPVAAMLAQQTGLPTWVDNDATAACTAERRFGAGIGTNNLVYIHAGSGGIGGGVVVNGRQMRGATGYAGEVGHIQISSSKIKDYSGLEGTLEALVKRDDLLELFKIDNATDEELEIEIIKNKDPKAHKVLMQQIADTGRAIGVLATIFNPQSVVLGGFLGTLFRFDGEHMIQSTRQSSLKSAQDGLLIKASQLGTTAVIVGAAELPFSAVLANPAQAKLTKVATKR
ncbi:MAG: hypothetical protein RL508_128 [Actinomycetota bacterium]|jgi:predicted NBD/HSP70 family sugar kinase